MREKIKIDHGSLESGLKQLNEWRVPKSVKSEVRRFVDDLALGKVNRGKKIQPGRQLKYLQALRTPLEFFAKPTANLKLGDIEQFERALGTGKISNRLTGKPYAHNTQVDVRMLLKIFLRWRLGVTKTNTLVGWLDTRTRFKTPDFLSENEIEMLFKHCHDSRQKFLVAVLFDSGARAEEFHNIRLEDVSLPEGKDTCVKIALKEEYSKTNGRTVALFWKKSTEAVNDYLTERIAAGAKPGDPVFDGSYDATKKQLQRMGHRVLKRPVHYHLFRHSSATYYAAKLNRQELCYRYGWRFSSNMPDVYISRSGMESRALEEKFTQTEMAEIKAELVQMEQAGKIKDDRIHQMGVIIDELQKQYDGLHKDFENLIKAMGLNPTAKEAKLALKHEVA